jgi:glutaryl-CoA dehydrogenase
METVARRHPTKKGVYLLSGSKTWITNSPISDVLMVWAKLDGKIRGFLVERATAAPGTISTPAIKNKNGLRASITGMIMLDGVEVPEENMFPDIEGLRGPFSCLNNARYGIAWGTIGALEDCLMRARTYALERKQFKGNPLAKYQLVQKKLANASTDAAFGLAAALQVGRLKDRGLVAPEMISMIKRQNCDRALVNARELVSIESKASFLVRLTASLACKKYLAEMLCLTNMESAGMSLTCLSRKPMRVRVISIVSYTEQLSKQRNKELMEETRFDSR